MLTEILPQSPGWGCKTF